MDESCMDGARTAPRHASREIRPTLPIGGGEGSGYTRVAGLGKHAQNDYEEVESLALAPAPAPMDSNYSEIGPKASWRSASAANPARSGEGQCDPSAAALACCHDPGRAHRFIVVSRGSIGPPCTCGVCAKIASPVAGAMLLRAECGASAVVYESHTGVPLKDQAAAPAPATATGTEQLSVDLARLHDWLLPRLVSWSRRPGARYNCICWRARG